MIELHQTSLQDLLDSGTEHLKQAEAIQLKLEGQLQAKEAQFKELQKNVSEAKTREILQPEIKKVLEALQRSEHERAVGTFEKLLTALLNDILPGDRQILLDLSSSAGLASLDISILKDLNIPEDFEHLNSDERQALNLEDALHGAGGAVANVLSMGLRMITLIRSGQRRFLVLDEADCWIKPTLVGAFAKVVQQAAIELGIQVLMISHHEESFFSDIPHRLYLRQIDSGLKADWSVDGGQPVWEDDQVGFRSIAMFGFQSHESTYLPLSPGLTLLYGENDIGKSSVVTALRAVFYGETSDALIRHQEPSAKVIVEMENNKVLVWERHRKPQGKDKNKGLYTLKQAGLMTPLHESPKAKGVPDWLLSETGMGMVDDLDVQIGSQKDPVFLLNKPASQRAKALAVGSDTGFVQIMMDIAKEELSEAKTIIKQGEKQLEILHRDIHARKDVRDIHLTSFLEEQKIFEKKLKQFQQLSKLQEQWSQALKRQNILQNIAHIQWPKEPTLTSVHMHRYLLERWQKAFKTVQTLEPISLVEIERLNTPILNSQQYQKNWTLLNHWKKASLVMTTLKEISLHQPHLPPPSLNLDERARVLQLIEKWKMSMEQEQCLLQQSQEDKIALEKAQNELISLYPAICPTCQQPWPHEHQKHQSDTHSVISRRSRKAE